MENNIGMLSYNPWFTLFKFFFEIYDLAVNNYAR